MNFTDLELPSNKKFGFFFSGVFLLVSTYFYLESVTWVCYLCATLSFSFLIVTLWKPDFLRPLNKLWMLFGFLLGMIVSPIVLGIVFFVYSAYQFINAFFRCDELRLRFMKKKTYWIAHDFKNAQSSTFRNQF